MNELPIILQFIAILFLCFLLYKFFQYIQSVKRKNRLNDFSININKEESNNSLILSFIFKFSKLLDSLVIFNGIARTYDEYIDADSHLKRGLDYISIKILTGTIFIILYFLIVFLYRQELSITIVLINFILGYVIPDFYCISIGNKMSKISINSLLNSIIIINNSYKAGRSTEQALNDVIKNSSGRLKKEYSRVLNDIKLGMSTYEAFKLMHKRTKNPYILELSNYLYSISKSGISPNEVLSKLEQKLIRQEKKTDELIHLFNLNIIVSFILITIPLIFIIYIMFFKLDLSMIFVNSSGVFIILILCILYTLYSMIIWHIAKGSTK